MWRYTAENNSLQNKSNFKLRHTTVATTNVLLLLIWTRCFQQDVAKVISSYTFTVPTHAQFQHYISLTIQRQTKIYLNIVIFKDRQKYKMTRQTYQINEVVYMSLVSRPVSRANSLNEVLITATTGNHNYISRQNWLSFSIVRALSSWQ